VVAEAAGVGAADGVEGAGAAVAAGAAEGADRPRRLPTGPLP